MGGGGGGGGELCKYFVTRSMFKKKKCIVQCVHVLCERG